MLFTNVSQKRSRYSSLASSKSHQTKTCFMYVIFEIFFGGPHPANGMHHATSLINKEINNTFLVRGFIIRAYFHTLFSLTLTVINDVLVYIEPKNPGIYLKKVSTFRSYIYLQECFRALFIVIQNFTSCILLYMAHLSRSGV